MKAAQRLLIHLSSSVYPYFLESPKPNLETTEKCLLVEIARVAPKRILIRYLVPALFTYFSPLLLFKSHKRFHKLSNPKREELMRSLSASPIYLVRILYFAARGHAFMTLFRSPELRSDYGFAP